MLTDAKFEDADFANADVRGADFKGAVRPRVELDTTHTVGVDFEHVLSDRPTALLIFAARHGW